jgi:hypothetical protein
MLSRSRAGHPPVCIAVEGAEGLPTGLAEVLVQLGNAAALAVDAQRLYAEEHNLTALDQVRTIVLFTDGLVEDRPPDIDGAMERLRTWPDFDRDPEDLCDDLIAHFGRDKSDDIALLVLRRTGE